MKLLLLVSLFLLFHACTSAPTRKVLSEKEAPQLTEEEAHFRAKKVSDVNYKLTFDLSKKNESYTGQSLISFNLNSTKSDLRVDFHNGEVRALIVNGKKSIVNYNKHYLLIEKADLKEGENSIVVDFKTNYSRDGSGFYRFVDPEDKRIYTYTDLEPFDANKVFPCFDQPNLKATYTMEVLAPISWEVVTSTLPTKIKTIDGKSKQWSFPKSAVFSTYIWSLHAGPYAKVVDKKAKYPSRLFMRKSFQKYVNVKDWQVFTRQGFEFLDDYFGYKYPYKKYDQLIVPDFNAGAMENVASVTFSERYVSRGVKLAAKRRKHANVVFHEMAHMWFGNLVTMNWWNDLWLNESFATYIANLGVSRNTEFKETAWRDFRGTKEWALWEDQNVTTHPIEAVVPDTSQAFANFDGITYGKGASSLKQIHYFLGEEGFKKGLNIYFKRHANTNTELKDFMKALSEGAGKDLKDWQKKWLQNTGVSTLSVDYKCNDKNKVNSFKVTQRDMKNSSIIRPHAFELAFLDKEYKVSKTIKVLSSKRTVDVKDAIGLNCPSVVYSNYNDHDYVMVKLDDKSLLNLEKNIHKVSDKFLRQVLWSTLWQMVYYGEYDYMKFIKLVDSNLLGKEYDDVILAKVFKNISRGLYNSPSALFYLEKDKTIDSSKKNEIISSLENKVWSLLKRSKAKSENQKILYNGYINIARSPKHLSNLRSLLSGKIKLSGFKIDQDKRWGIIYRLSAYNPKGESALITKEAKRDKSSLGKKMKLSSLAITANSTNKKMWIKEYLNPKSEYSFSEMKSVIYSLYPYNQLELRDNYKNFFKDLKWLNKNRDLSVAEKFTSIGKLDCTENSIQDIHNFIQENSDLKAGVLKELRIKAQENEKCKKVLELSQK